MHILSLILLLSVGVEFLVWDFGEEKDGRNWQIINDGVMGGRSQSSARLLANSLWFEGNISLDNNGGFASLRAPFGKYDLEKYSNVKMRCKGTARDFALVLETRRAFYLPNYKYTFRPNPNEWQIIDIALDDFQTQQMGEPIGGNLPITERSKIIRIGIILFDKKPGDFELELDYLRFE